MGGFRAGRLPATKGAATMHTNTSEFWIGLSDLLAKADSHPVDSRDEDSGDLHRDRDAYLVGEHLKAGMQLWPLIMRDASRDPVLDAKLRHANEIQGVGYDPLKDYPPKADIFGREYARIGDLCAGSAIQFDDGHGDCMPDQAVRQVKYDADCELYVECNCGKHYLVDDDGILVGVYRLLS
jgi:hypothetical protein